MRAYVAMYWRNRSSGSWPHVRPLSVGPCAPHRVDTSAVAALPEVQVFTAADLPLHPLAAPPFVRIDERFARPLIASEKVRFAGDIVGVVLAETREASVDAVELVDVEYEPLRR